MPKINNPLTGHGKMIIRYKGNNELLRFQPCKMRRIYMHREKKIQADVYENLLLETQLFDGTNICFSVKSSNLYYRHHIDGEEIWIHSEPSFVHFTFVNVDDEFVLFDGQITFVKEISRDFIINEDYDIMLIYRKSKDWMDLLEKNNIEYELHSYSKPELQDEI
ncbi:MULTISPECIES: hypothetical protein [unclassified Flavobacterium]|jgi:hypothetical protein|uniref:hypothetical protein n=1 Tax=unclassified Flavobacterium TaxID=196869 RepID=UPI0025BF480E|nr:MULTISPECIES: hypothetical protein [unclassified Flavobacterium]